MTEELITINPGEALPGFPSGHGPGDYLVDFEARTIRPVPAYFPPIVEISQPEAETTTESQPETTTDSQGG